MGEIFGSFEEVEVFERDLRLFVGVVRLDIISSAIKPRKNGHIVSGTYLQKTVIGNAFEIT